MKIQNNQFEEKIRYSDTIESYLFDVTKPFEFQMQSLQLNVYCVRVDDFHCFLGLDWNLYQLIVFNIVQNAIKYNRSEGDIVIMLSCKQVDHSEQYVLET